MPQKSTYFFPKLPSGLLFHASVTDWLELCRAAAARWKACSPSLPTRDERELVVGAGEGGDDTTAIDEAAERAVVALLDERQASTSRSLGGARAPRGVVRTAPSPSCSIPIDGSINAKRGIPFFSLSIAVADGPDDGRCRLRVRPRLRLGGGVVGGPRRRRNGSTERPSTRRCPRSRSSCSGWRRRRPRSWPSTLRRSTPIAERLRVMGSLALSLCHLAAGRVDAVASLRPARSVDIAAAQLVARERGVDRRALRRAAARRSAARPRAALAPCRCGHPGRLRASRRRAALGLRFRHAGEARSGRGGTPRRPRRRCRQSESRRR